MPLPAGTAVKIVLPVLAALVLTDCSSEPNGIYSQYFQVVREGFAQGFGSKRVSRDDAAAIPYASMGYRVDGGRENLLVLASDISGDQLWTAKSHVVILTRGGRIARTIGLPHDVASMTSQKDLPLPPISDALRGMVSTTRFADFPDISAYGVSLNCSAAAIRPETITILGNAMPTVRVNETCRSASLRWSFVDNFWIDQQSGIVRRSLQHIHPKGETVETEIFVPRAKEHAAG